MSKILLDKEIADGRNPLNSKQVDVFNVVHIYYLKYNERDIEQIHTFISGNWSTNLIRGKVMYIAISEILICMCKYPEEPRVLLLGSTGYTVNAGHRI